MKDKDKPFLVVWGRGSWQIFDTVTQITTGRYKTAAEAHSSLEAIQTATEALTLIGDMNE